MLKDDYEDFRGYKIQKSFIKTFIIPQYVNKIHKRNKIRYYVLYSKVLYKSAEHLLLSNFNRYSRFIMN